MKSESLSLTIYMALTALSRNEGPVMDSHWQSWPEVHYYPPVYNDQMNLSQAALNLASIEYLLTEL